MSSGRRHCARALEGAESHVGTVSAAATGCSAPSSIQGNLWKVSLFQALFQAKKLISKKETCEKSVKWSMFTQVGSESVT